jgi:hypothetical protein
MEGLNTALDAYLIKKGGLQAPYDDLIVKLNALIKPSEVYAAEVLKTAAYIRLLALAKKTLVAPSQQRIAALQTLIAPMQNKAKKTLDYAASVKKQTQLELETREIYLEMEGLRKDEINADLAVMAKQLAAGDYEEALLTAEVALKKLTQQNRAKLVTDDAKDMAKYLTHKETGQKNVIAKEKEAGDKQVDTRYEVAKIKIAAQLESIKTTISARAGRDGSIEEVSRIHASERTQTATIAAGAKITSTLIHQLT